MNSRSLARKDDRSVDNIKTAVLGKKYELSLVYGKNALMRKLNATYRGKDKPTNVLAFPLGKDSGEIFINIDRKDDFSDLELLVHALLHLKGMRHSAKMERAERKFLKLFNGSPSRSRHRHRHSPSQGGHRRRG